MSMNDLYFCVAEATFHVRFHDIADARPLLPSYAPFHIKEQDQPLMFEMNVAAGLVTAEAEGEEVGNFDCGGCNHGIYRTEDGGYKMLISNVDGKLACALRTTADFTCCEASLHGDESIMSFGLNNALMIAFAFAGAKHNILLIHASVPMKDGKAYCFLGKSGTGKSTHSGLWLEHIDGTDLLNDDNPAIRVIDGVVYVYGTPWSGKTPCYRNLRMLSGGFLRLEQAPENAIRKESKLQGFASIISSCSSMIWDKTSYHAICDTVSMVAERVPVFYLRNLPNREAALLSHSTMTGEA